MTTDNGGSHQSSFVFQHFHHSLCIPRRLDRAQSLISPSFPVRQLKAAVFKLQVTQGNISVPTAKILSTKESPPPFWVALKFFKPFSQQNQTIDYKKNLSLWRLTIFLFNTCGRLLEEKARSFQAPKQYQNIASTQVQSGDRPVLLLTPGVAASKVSTFCQETLVCWRWNAPWE